MANRYWVGGTGTWNTSSTTNWSASSGGGSGASVPTAADSVFFDQAGTYTVTMTGALTCLDITVSAGTVTFATGTSPTLAVSGSMTLLTGTLWTSTGRTTFNATTTGKTITTNGVSFPCSFTFNGASGAWSLGGALTITGFGSPYVSLTNGTLDLNGKTFTVAGPSTPGFRIDAGTKNLTFNGGTLLITAAGTLTFNNSNPTGFTTTAGTGTGVISLTGATDKTFVGGGSTYNCTLNQGGAGTLSITGANTFSDITNTYGGTGATTITFPAGTTTTVAAFTANGTSGKLLTLNSNNPGVRATLSKSSGTVNASYLSIQDSAATGGATWNATNSTNAGNNTGWNISGATSSAGFLLFF